MAQIEIQNINKTFQVDKTDIKAVENVSLNVERGEFVSIIGHSGSGKTSLLSIIGGILKPTSGSMIFNSTDIYSLKEDSLSEYRADKVGYIFQFASLLPVLTTRENLLLPNIFRSDRSNNNNGKAGEYLEMVGLGEKINVYPSQLSGGQQRRVAIARALMNDPEVIIADEPTGDLDEETENDVMDLFMQINRERCKTLILVTHDTDLAKYASRRLRMAHGKLVNIDN